jgi:hypothetical protein
MSSSKILFYSDNSNNKLEIITTNCNLEAITGPTGPTYIDKEPVYDSCGNQIWIGPDNPYNDVPTTKIYYETTYTISVLNENSSTLKITNTNGFYWIDQNNWIKESNSEDGSILTFSYSTNPTLSVINSIETTARKSLYNITSFLDNGLTNTSKTIKKFI